MLNQEKLETKPEFIAEQAVQKQYELAVTILQNETGRFWTRFNIFIGIQFIDFYQRCITYCF